MNATIFARLILAAALLVGLTAQLQADPIVCNPKVTVAPPESSAVGSSWFSQLFASSDKPQPFSGVITDDPDPGCSISNEVRTVVSRLGLRNRETSLD
ncbi:MAG: hypothetical protein ABIP49_05690 [Lysobacterales bacterium]